MKTHTFLSQWTGIADFAAMALHHGADAITRNRGKWLAQRRLHFGRRRARLGHIVPTFPDGGYARRPGSEDAAVELFARHFFRSWTAEAELDGIFLVLHGAMVSDSSTTPGGPPRRDPTLLTGAAFPSRSSSACSTCDANVAQKLIDNCSVAVAYRENPHRDAQETAVRAARILGDLMETPGQPGASADRLCAAADRRRLVRRSDARACRRRSRPPTLRSSTSTSLAIPACRSRRIAASA